MRLHLALHPTMAGIAGSSHAADVALGADGTVLEEGRAVFRFGFHTDIESGCTEPVGAVRSSSTTSR